MSDLISRKELIDYFYYGIDDKPIIDGISDRKIIDIIKNQPTAYDINKIVEELEENASRYTKKYTTPYGNNGYKDIKAISIRKAIEIVKQGGVTDDVCEWKQDNMCEKVYMVCGGCFTSVYQKDFKYCPYCGKKIKIVGD